MAKAIQVHLSTPVKQGAIHQMTWMETALKPQKGMIVETKGDRRQWTVIAVYSISAEIDGLAPWKEAARATAGV